MTQLQKLLESIDSYPSEGNSPEKQKELIRLTIKDFCQNHRWETEYELDDELNDFINKLT